MSEPEARAARGLSDVLIACATTFESAGLIKT